MTSCEDLISQIPQDITSIGYFEKNKLWYGKDILDDYLSKCNEPELLELKNITSNQKLSFDNYIEQLTHWHYKYYDKLVNSVVETEVSHPTKDELQVLKEDIVVKNNNKEKVISKTDYVRLALIIIPILLIIYLMVTK